ncbi:hypothetical protein CK621_02310 [Vandammella animalimorsus]|uniref:Uncharacterized protein n=1 Tax=Vandammella animalimorsus TaxID=2029117 RepID=A0A2A2B0V1_9BURK|nr:hypothetical protein CK621_02310 [Vandammella animalimorsus]
MSNRTGGFSGLLKQISFGVEQCVWLARQLSFFAHKQGKRLMVSHQPCLYFPFGNSENQVTRTDSASPQPIIQQGYRASNLVQIRQQYNQLVLGQIFPFVHI